MIVTAILAILLISSSLFFVHSSMINPTPFVKIIAPDNGSNVSIVENINGVSINVPDGDVIWLVVKSGENYYPMKAAADTQTYGSWPTQVNIWSSVAHIDSAEFTVFKVIAILADKNIQDKINQYNDLAHNKLNDTYAGFSENEWVALGIKVNDIVTVNLQKTTITPTSSPSPSSSVSSSPSSSTQVTTSPSVTPSSQPTQTPSPSSSTISTISPAPSSSTTTTSPSLSSPSPTVTPPEPSVGITYPTNNSMVNLLEYVNGTSQNIPSDQKLWIVVYDGGLYYPMVDAVTPVNGKWSYNTPIGTASHINTTFTILTVLVNNSAQNTFKNWTEVFDTPKHEDMGELPSGTTVCDKVTVTRR